MPFSGKRRDGRDGVKGASGLGASVGLTGYHPNGEDMQVLEAGFLGVLGELGVIQLPFPGYTGAQPDAPKLRFGVRALRAPPVIFNVGPRREASLPVGAGRVACAVPARAGVRAVLRRRRLAASAVSCTRGRARRAPCPARPCAGLRRPGRAGGRVVIACPGSVPW